MCNNCSSPKFINHISSVPPALMKVAEDFPLLSKFKDIYAMAYDKQIWKLLVYTRFQFKLTDKT